MVIRNGKIFSSLREIAPLGPYSADYLRIRILQKKLRGIKIGREWYTTKEWLEAYLSRYAIRSIQEQFAPRASEAPVEVVPAGVAPPEVPPPLRAAHRLPKIPGVPVRELLPRVSARLFAVPIAALLAFVLVYPAAGGMFNRIGTFLIEHPVPDAAAIPEQMFAALDQVHALGRGIIRDTAGIALQYAQDIAFRQAQDLLALRYAPDITLRKARAAAAGIRNGLAAVGYAVQERIAILADRLGTMTLEAEIPALSISSISRTLADHLGELVLEGRVPPVGERARAAARAVLLGAPAGTRNIAEAMSNRVGRLALETEVPPPGKLAGGALAAAVRWEKGVERFKKQVAERIAAGSNGLAALSRAKIGRIGTDLADIAIGIAEIEQASEQKSLRASGLAFSRLARAATEVERAIEQDGRAAAGFVLSEFARSAKEAFFAFPVRLAEVIGLKRAPVGPPSDVGWQEVGVELAEAEPSPETPPVAGPIVEHEITRERQVTDVTRVREVVETREVVRPANLAEIERRLSEFNAGLRSQVNKLVSDVAALYEGPEAKVSVVRAFAPSQKIDRLSGITFTGLNTFQNDVEILGNLRVSGSCSGCGGGGSGTINSGTTNRLSYYSGATTLDSANFLAVDTTDSRIGIATGTPGTALSVTGAGVFTDSLAAKIFKATSKIGRAHV